METSIHMVSTFMSHYSYWNGVDFRVRKHKWKWKERINVVGDTYHLLDEIPQPKRSESLLGKPFQNLVDGDINEQHLFDDKPGELELVVRKHRWRWKQVEETAAWKNDALVFEQKGATSREQFSKIRYETKEIQNPENVLTGAVTAKNSGLKQLEEKLELLRVAAEMTVADKPGILFSTKKHPKTKELMPEDFWIGEPKQGIVVLALPGEYGRIELVMDLKVHFHDSRGKRKRNPDIELEEKEKRKDKDKWHPDIEKGRTWKLLCVKRGYYVAVAELMHLQAHFPNGLFQAVTCQEIQWEWTEWLPIAGVTRQNGAYEALRKTVRLEWLAALMGNCKSGPSLLGFMRSKRVLLVSHELSFLSGPLLLKELAFLLRSVGAEIGWIIVQKLAATDEVLYSLEHKMLVREGKVFLGCGCWIFDPRGERAPRARGIGNGADAFQSSSLNMITWVFIFSHEFLTPQSNGSSNGAIWVFDPGGDVVCCEGRFRRSDWCRI